MRKRAIKAALMCMATVLFLAGCQDGGARNKAGTAQRADGKDEVTTLTCYFQNGYNGVERFPWFENYLGENLGIFLESRIQTADSSILAPMLASGELTDIIEMGQKEDIASAISGDMLLDLEAYKNQLPHIFGNEKYQKAIAYAKDTFGGLYVMPMVIGENRSIVVDPQLRWDLYKKLGMPEIPDMYGLLDVLEQMQDMEPETADGLPVYGLGAFNSWDGNNMMQCAYFYYMVSMGYAMEGLSTLAYMKYDGSEGIHYLLEDESVYKDALRWLYTANQMGLLDPESATMNYEGYVAKAGNAQYLYTTWDWFGYGDPDGKESEDWWGHASVWTEDSMIPVYPVLSVGHPHRFMGIGSKCVDVDKALAFLDWYYSDEGIDLLFNGPEGMLWEYDENGKKVFTDLYYENDYLGNPYEHPEGGRVFNIAEFNWDLAVHSTAKTENGQTYNLSKDSYAKVRHTRTKLEEDFIKNNDGYESRFERAEAEGRNLIASNPALNFVSPTSGDIEEIRGQIGEIVVQNSWKMVYARDQAEFDALWAKTQADAEALGGRQVFEDVIARWNRALESSEKYVN